MKDRLITIFFSVAATYGLLQITPKQPKELEVDDYTSHNASRMTVKEIEQMLLSLPEVTCELGH